jgi:hypothetical protein
VSEWLVRLIGGPYDRALTVITDTPKHIAIEGAAYERIDDPDSGEYLGGYVFRPRDAP